ncbi:MAG: NAD(P)-binding domain-containing protein, partial [Burkholderiales bacterium]
MQFDGAAGDGPVGIVGLGLIGTSLAKRLIAAGFDVHGYDLDEQRGELLTTLGGKPEPSLAALGARCRTIVISVLSTDQVESVLESDVPGGPLG